MAVDGNAWWQVNILGNLSSDKPVVTILTLVVVLVVVVAGAIVTITNPNSLTFEQYIRDIAILGAGLGLGNGIGRGIESSGHAQASARKATHRKDI